MMSLRQLSVVVWLCASANFLNQSDRTIMSYSIVPISTHYGVSTTMRGWILSSFTFGYIATQTLAGPTCSYFGSSMAVLRGAVLAWSMCTILTPACISLIASEVFLPLLVVRALMGAAEGFCWPAAYQAINTCTKASSRSRASSILVAGGNLGQLAAIFFSTVHWSTQFVTLGLIGVAWVVHSVSYYRDVEADEVTSAPAPSPHSFLRQYWFLLRHRGLLAAYTAHFCGNALYYMYFLWMPSYLHEVHGVDPKGLTILALPLIVICVCGPLYGMLCDYLVHEAHVVSLRTVRVLMTTISLGGAGLIAVIIANSTTPDGAVALYTLSALCTSAHGSGYMANHADIVPGHTGLSFGLSNMIATVPGVLIGPLGAAAINMGRWDLIFYSAAAVSAFGSVVYAVGCSVELETREIGS